MVKSKKTLGPLLIERGKITENELEKFEAAAKRNEKKLEDILIEKKIVTEEYIAEVTSEELGVPFLDLKNYITDPEVLKLLDIKSVRRLIVLPLYIIRDTITIAMANPRDVMALDEIKSKVKDKKIQIIMGTKSAILESIEQNYTLGYSLQDILKPICSSGTVYAPAVGVTPQTLRALAGEPPVVRFVNQMIFDALNNKASDIHIEPTQEKIKIRFRIDGILHETISIPQEIHLPIIPRIKILAGMDIAENRRPQDGRFSVSVVGRKIDMRVAAFPIAYGECVTLRLLDRATSLLKIEELGFFSDTRTKFQKFITKPHGIILVTGPVGSGKTSTLYAALNKISSPEKNIVTIEDPIEYLLENVNQSQVNLKVGIDFATALRSFLRQDPDVILVGEIRDNETAKMAFRAALTGQLVFSTLHTNDAPTAIPRLKDFGVDNDSLSSSIICVIAQRLVRLICPICKEVYHPDEKRFGELITGLDPKTVLYRGKGCDDCHKTGYKGRIGIFELLEFVPEIQKLVFEAASLGEIKKAAIDKGMRTLMQDAMDKVKQGLTTVDEVIRVTQD